MINTCGPGFTWFHLVSPGFTWFLGCYKCWIAVRITTFLGPTVNIPVHGQFTCTKMMKKNKSWRFWIEFFFWQEREKNICAMERAFSSHPVRLGSVAAGASLSAPIAPHCRWSKCLCRIGNRSFVRRRKGYTQIREKGSLKKNICFPVATDTNKIGMLTIN